MRGIRSTAFVLVVIISMVRFGSIHPCHCASFRSGVNVLESGLKPGHLGLKPGHLGLKPGPKNVHRGSCFSLLLPPKLVDVMG